MAAPQLVIADAPYKKYPGGVIVLRAADWLAGARGTLSTEADARSCCGTVVRDTQKVTASIYTTDVFGTYTAFQEADNTLVVPLASIPFNEGVAYTILTSILIEGDWDVNNVDTLNSGDQEQFAFSCQFRFSHNSTGVYAAGNQVQGVLFQPRKIDNYRITGFGSTVLNTAVPSDHILLYRAYSQDGTSINYLIDQLYFIPHYLQGGGDADPTSSDIEVVPGQASTFGSYDLSTGQYVDGADGGDAYGKFTWHPGIWDSPTGLISNEGGGDYQRKSGSSTAEYMARVVPSDGYFLSDSRHSFPDNEPSGSHAYGVHGPFFIPTQTWVNDTFSRTDGTGNFGAFGDPQNTFGGHDWGLTPEGFRWRNINGPSGPTDIGFPDPQHRHGKAVFTNGTAGGIKIRYGENVGLQQVSVALGPTSTEGAGVRADNMRMRLKFWVVNSNDAAQFDADSSPAEIGTFIRISSGVTTALNTYHIYFDWFNKTWSLRHNSTNVVIVGPTDISAWWNFDTKIGIHIEVRRYLLRIKVWDFSAGEPGTFDYDQFRPLYRGTVKNYPYQTSGVDDLEWSLQEVELHTPNIVVEAGNHRYNGCQTIYFDDVTVEYDVGGDNASSFFSIEKPEGTELGQIETPAGCQHLIYWGHRDWTTFVGGDGPYIQFSAKGWNDPSAALLQRAESLFWWFRSGRFDLIPMNWRSADRSGHPWRVLSG